MDARRICLIIPPSPFLLDERVFPFLGPLKVAAVLEKKGYGVDVLDLSGIQNYLDAVADYAESSAAPVFGVTATTPQFPAAVNIARMLRARARHAKVIIGGTHATLVVAGVRTEKSACRAGRAHRALRQLEEEFDVIVAGDGERTIFLALREDSPRLIDADDHKRSPYFLRDNDEELESVFPARHLIDLESYHYRVDGAPATSLIAQLGCPYRCGFCAGRSSSMLRNIRTRSAQSVVAEMLHIHKTWGKTGFMFYDDELNVNPEMIALMQQLAKVQRDLGVRFKLRGFIKSERFTSEQAQAMWEAGFRHILVGFESGSPRILENMQKIATQADNTRCMDIARSEKHPLKVKALMSLGHPGESKTSVEETRRWLIDVKPHDFDATVITPYPGSPYYDRATPVEGREDVWVYACKNGDRLFQEEVNYARDADYYKGDPNDGYVSHVWTDALTRHELVSLRNTLESDVRSTLGIPFNPSAASQLYEHSMGQSGLSTRILRSSAPVFG